MSSSFIHSSKSFIQSSSNSSGKIMEVQCGKDFIDQFDKCLRVDPASAGSPAATTTTTTSSSRKSRSDFRTTAAATSSIGKRRKNAGNNRRVRKAFALRPSKLNFLPGKDLAESGKKALLGGKNSEHFSFENCSKELESIMQRSTLHSNSAIRPRSSSLPNTAPPPYQASYQASKPGVKIGVDDAPCNACRQMSPKEKADFSKLVFSHSKNASKKLRQKAASKQGQSGGSNKSDSALKASTPAVTTNVTPTGATKRKCEQAASQGGSASCAQQARQDLSQDIDRLTDFLEESIMLPKKMSYMAEMMYT